MLSTQRMSVLFMITFICGCVSPARWVEPENFRSSSKPDIDAIVLTTGQRINFDETLGWYNVRKAVIEGRSILGTGMDTFRLQDIQLMRVVAQTDVNRTVILLALIILPFVGWAYALHIIGEAGG